MVRYCIMVMQTPQITNKYAMVNSACSIWVLNITVMVIFFSECSQASAVKKTVKISCYFSCSK